jgi:hypothetical protein
LHSDPPVITDSPHKPALDQFFRDQEVLWRQLALLFVSRRWNDSWMFVVWACEVACQRIFEKRLWMSLKSLAVGIS